MDCVADLHSASHAGADFARRYLSDVVDCSRKFGGKAEFGLCHGIYLSKLTDPTVEWSDRNLTIERLDHARL